MSLLKLSTEEYIEFLKYKKEKILKQAESEAHSIDQQIAKLFSQPKLFEEKFTKDEPTIRRLPEKDINGKSKTGSIGWRDIIKEILSQSSKPMTYSQIVDSAMKHPRVNVPRKTAQKTIGSNLATYWKEPFLRYNRINIGGKMHYTLNRG